MTAILEKHSIRLGDELGVAVQKMDALGVENRQLLVLDRNNFFKTFLFDYHIRLSILNGLTLTSLVHDLVGLDGNLASSYAAHFSTADDYISNLYRDPIIKNDSRGRVTDIKFGELRGKNDYKVMIMAGGFGRRLGELTRETPKPLIQIQKRPILSYVIDQVLETQPIKLYLSVHYLAYQFKQFIQSDACPAAINIVDEAQPLGTAGAIGLIEKSDELNLLVLNADILSDLKLSNVCHFHDACCNDITIVVKTHRSYVPFGVVNCDEWGRVLSIVEKPDLKNYVAAGIYVLSPKAQRLVNNGEKLDMPDLIGRAKEERMKVSAFPIFEYWADLGNPIDLEKASNRLNSQS